MAANTKISRVDFFARAWFKLVLSVFFIFIIAGRWDYIQGWVLMGISVVVTLIGNIAFRDRVGLFQERLKPGPGVKGWDKVMVALYHATVMGTFAIGLLDGGRYRWSPPIPIAGYVIAYLGIFAGTYFSLRAMYVNEFFSSRVRIQTDRGHTVCEKGPYRRLRHPGYTGMIVTTMLTPIILGSLWGLIPASAGITVIVIRTALEDKTLINELPGYAGYARKVRCRLIPGIW